MENIKGYFDLSAYKFLKGSLNSLKVGALLHTVVC